MTQDIDTQEDDDDREYYAEADAAYNALPVNERMVDRIRGGPLKRLMRYAHEASIDFDDMIRQMKEMCTGERESEFDQGLSQDWRESNWDDFTMIYKMTPPPNISRDWFSCAC